ncbi:hypothetical protein [Anaplasma centrale]|nr:hypothetical protein [Anaplasma centrale]
MHNSEGGSVQCGGGGAVVSSGFLELGCRALISTLVFVKNVQVATCSSIPKYYSRTKVHRPIIELFSTRLDKIERSSIGSAVAYGQGKIFT